MKKSEQNQNLVEGIITTIIGLVIAAFIVTFTYASVYLAKAFWWAIKKAVRSPKVIAKVRRVKPQPAALYTPPCFQGLDNLAPAKQFDLKKI